MNLLKHGLAQTHWKTIFDGYGKITFDPLVMEPKVATVDTVTHACMMTSEIFNKTLAKDFYLSMQVNTMKQLRTPVPKSWECFWVFFNCTFDPVTGKKSTNYFTLKPTGVEVGTATKEIDQKFLVTATNPILKINTVQNINIKKVNKSMFIGIDGKEALSFTNAGLIDVPGTIALYTEDAKVCVSALSFAYLDTNGNQCFLG